METQEPKLQEDLSLSQKVVNTLSRIGVSSGQVCDVIRIVHEINSKGVFKKDIPGDKIYIVEELARDGVISVDSFHGKTIYIERGKSLD